MEGKILNHIAKVGFIACLFYFYLRFQVLMSASFEPLLFSIASLFVFLICTIPLIQFGFMKNTKGKIIKHIAKVGAIACIFYFFSSIVMWTSLLFVETTAGISISAFLFLILNLITFLSCIIPLAYFGFKKK